MRFMLSSKVYIITFFIAVRRLEDILLFYIVLLYGEVYSLLSP